ncbi:glycerol-3-phosphate 1-O-acyltransferase PlsY [Aquifex pyrophilus]
MGVFLIIFSYLLGSILFGEIIAKLKGINLREVGSGNVGATNVSRALGKRYGALVFFLDMLKGFVPTALAVELYGYDSWITPLTGIASVLGHMFPLYFGLKGGKGVATAFGVLIALSPSVALASILVWFIVLALTRYVSLSSLVASFSAVIYLLVLEYPPKIIVMALIIFLLILYKHRGNIERLVQGRELKV